MKIYVLKNKSGNYLKKDGSQTVHWTKAEQYKKITEIPKNKIKNVKVMEFEVTKKREVEIKKRIKISRENNEDTKINTAIEIAVSILNLIRCFLDVGYLMKGNEVHKADIENTTNKWINKYNKKINQ